MPIITNNSPITFSDPLPDEVDVVVIGAGVAGTATAYFLARRGAKVLLCDKGRVAGGLLLRRRADGGYIVATGDLIEHYLSASSFKYFTKFLKLLKASAKATRLADTFAGRKLATEKTPLADRVNLNIHLKERQGRRYLHFRFSDGDNQVADTDQVDELLGILRDFRNRM